MDFNSGEEVVINVTYLIGNWKWQKMEGGFVDEKENEENFDDRSFKLR
jgi:hypothetical protein